MTVGIIQIIYYILWIRTSAKGYHATDRAAVPLFFRNDFLTRRDNQAVRNVKQLRPALFKQFPGSHYFNWPISRVNYSPEPGQICISLFIVTTDGGSFSIISRYFL